MRHQKERKPFPQWIVAVSLTESYTTSLDAVTSNYLCCSEPEPEPEPDYEKWKVSLFDYVIGDLEPLSYNICLAYTHYLHQLR